MSYSVRGYEDRVAECTWLANSTDDNLIQIELLKMRQTYVQIAARLRAQGFEERPKRN